LGLLACRHAAQANAETGVTKTNREVGQRHPPCRE